MGSSISHPKHDFEDTRQRNPTNMSMHQSPLNVLSEIVMLSDSSTLWELNRLETIALESATPTVG